MNLVLLIGHLGKDPEVKQTPGGTSVANFSVATDESYKDKSGEWQKKTEWHNVVVWGAAADAAGDHLKKGSRVCIQGKLQTRSWEQGGEKKYKTEVVATSVIYLDKSSKSDSGDEQTSRPSSSSRTASSNRTTSSRPVQRQENIDDEDIPF